VIFVERWAWKISCPDLSKYPINGKIKMGDLKNGYSLS
jgi:hypothetical protein